MYQTGNNLDSSAMANLQRSCWNTLDVRAALVGISVPTSNILSSLEGLRLDPKFCRAQTYDGAGNMDGRQKGCAKLFQVVAQRALYFHCASHELNLALCHACKVPEIQSMVCTLHSL